MVAASELTHRWAALSTRLAGAALAVGASSPTYARAHWSAGQLSEQPVTRSTTFYAASVTKQVVGALVARTVLDGHLDPRASISAFLAGLPAWTRPIRVHHLWP